MEVAARLGHRLRARMAAVLPPSGVGGRAPSMERSWDMPPFSYCRCCFDSRAGARFYTSTIPCYELLKTGKDDL